MTTTNPFRPTVRARLGRLGRSAGRILAIALATLALYAAFVLIHAYNNGVTGICPTEDSVGCVWFGPVQGNGHGPILINPAQLER